MKYHAMTNECAGLDQIRVLLAYDHSLVRAGIHAVIDRFEGVEVVAETGVGVETLRQIEKATPDIVLLDISGLGPDGLEILNRARLKFPEVGVIVLAMYESEEYAFQAMRRGAKGYLNKVASRVELELAIKAVACGETYLSPEPPRKTLVAVVNESTRKHDEPAKLTVRQYEVLRMVAEGYSTKGIAMALNISVKTVESHRAAVMERLNIHDIAGLVRYAMKNGLVKIY
jgi:DNA-binding NarL/FixJ family response regulator